MYGSVCLLLREFCPVLVIFFICKVTFIKFDIHSLETLANTLLSHVNISFSHMDHLWLKDISSNYRPLFRRYFSLHHPSNCILKDTGKNYPLSLFKPFSWLTYVIGRDTSGIAPADLTEAEVTARRGIRVRRGLGAIAT